MPPAKVTCPECDTVLKLANPPAPGKKLKCPKCATVFAAPETKETPAGPKKKAADKDKTDGGKAKKEPTRKKTFVDDDDGPATYAVFKEEEKEKDEDEEEEDKPKINYAPDMSLKDLRGPAQAAVIAPSNALIINGICGFLGWLGVLIVISVPFLFPLDNPGGTEQQQAVQLKPIQALSPGLGAVNQANFTPPQAPPKPKEGEEEGGAASAKFFGFDMFQVTSLGILVFLLAALVTLPGMIYGALIIIGAVKMQNLESRGWGIASAIMSMIPIHTSGLFVLTGILLGLLMGMVMDDAATVGFYVGGLGLGEWGGCIWTGIWGLRVLLRPDVKAGFEYKPD